MLLATLRPRYYYTSYDWEINTRRHGKDVAFFLIETQMIPIAPKLNASPLGQFPSRVSSFLVSSLDKERKAYRDRESPERRPQETGLALCDFNVHDRVQDAGNQEQGGVQVDGVPVDAGDVGAQDGGGEEGQVLHAVLVGGLGALEAGQGLGRDGALQLGGPLGAVRVGVVPAAVGGRLDDAEAVDVRRQRDDPVGGDGEQGVVDGHGERVDKSGTQWQGLVQA